ncbi:MAG: phosphopantothenoylcysteine decarboxylase [Planctomycetes bacterium]|nr:phosphopantothenoylcysteine decarboxylase [Planctomycetota bacterium]
MAELAANVLITAGPTHEFLDDVRFLSNPSIGRMGMELAKAARAAGAAVTVVCGPTHLAPPPGVRWIPVVSARDMLVAAKERFEACDVFIASAAVSDYRPKERFDGKLKKGAKETTLKLVQNPDILKTLGKKRRDGQVIVGYSLEVKDPVKHGLKKLKAKHCDLMVVNTPGHFGEGSEHVWIINDRGIVAELPPSGKDAVALKVIELAAMLHAGASVPQLRGFDEA